VQFAANKCPKGSVYGHARAFSPLLDESLEGPVYLRSSDNKLPDMVVDLQGQVMGERAVRSLKEANALRVSNGRAVKVTFSLQVELVGRIDSVNGGIRTTFEAVPDAPVSKFVLEMQGGKKGLIVNSRNLCASKQRASVKFVGQNGKRVDLRPVVRASCGGKKRKR
jgi:hypothetical protein